MNAKYKISNSFHEELALDFKDVFLLPQYTEVTSRKLVDTSSVLFPLDAKAKPTDIPIISANMDTVTDGPFAKAMAIGGGLGAIHRFMSIKDNVHHFKLAHTSVAKGVTYPCLVSVGVNEDSRERFQALYANGARHFVIDIAHGHSKMMKDMLEWIHSVASNVFIMAGNVATEEAVADLITWGANSIKVGIGPGNVCTTKNVTGVTVPQFTAIFKCAQVVKQVNTPVTIVADGGVTEIGDIAKALGAGADFVMCGRMFAACPETPGPRVNGKKVYRGMASRDAMLSVKEQNNLPTPEGISTMIESNTEPVANLLEQIKGGLQSAFSYANAANLAEFQQKSRFGVRMTGMR